MTDKPQALLPVTPELLPCPFCKQVLRRVPSLARAFDPPRPLVEYHHERNDCIIKLAMWAFYDDEPETFARFASQWNTRISHSLPGDDIVEEGYRGGYDFFRNKWIGDQEEMITDMVRCFVPRPLPRDVEDHAAIADKIIAAVKADDDCRGRGKFEVMQILAALTPSALSDLQRLGQEFDDGSLGRFGHYPEPAIDFECEVDQIESIVADLEKGMRQGEPVPMERIARAMTFRVGGYPGAWAAKATLRELEKRASALSVPVGDDLAKGLRTSQKALDEIARQEQANIAGYLALRDFPVGSASAQFPPDEVGPNALGSDGPSIAAQLREISRISNKYDLRECIEGHDDALGDSYIWRDLMDHCEKLGSKDSALSGDAGEGE